MNLNQRCKRIFGITYQENLMSDIWLSCRNYFLKLNPFCKVCGKKAIIAHHINYENLGNEKSKDLMSVCYRCHEKIHKRLK